MTDNGYIRKAAELADGWEFDDDIHGKVWIRPNYYTYANNDDSQQVYVDALAAQLVRQVDPNHHVDISWMTCEVRDGETSNRLAYIEYRGTTPPYEGCDRTMNTIKAIVDSKVLEA